MIAFPLTDGTRWSAERRSFKRMTTDAMKRADVAAISTVHACLHKTWGQLMRLAQVPNVPTSRGIQNAKNGNDFDVTLMDCISDSELAEYSPALVEAVNVGFGIHHDT